MEEEKIPCKLCGYNTFYIGEEGYKCVVCGTRVNFSKNIGISVLSVRENSVNLIIRQEKE